MSAAEERFWSKVHKSTGPDACWLWAGRPNSDGYGRIRVRGKEYMAHRLALEWAAGPCPSGLEACHSCRNRHCVNPEHLRWDTRRANEADKVKDGTDSRGERCASSRLTEQMVQEIRSAAAAGESQASLGRQYGVHSATVCLIVRRRTWKHLQSDVPIGRVAP